eukprot:1783712-Pleurochrysis_carterae.AAC.3
MHNLRHQPQSPQNLPHPRRSDQSVGRAERLRKQACVQARTGRDRDADVMSENAEEEAGVQIGMLHRPWGGENACRG